jgi:hypothetical protein
MEPKLAGVAALLILVVLFIRWGTKSIAHAIVFVMVFPLLVVFLVIFLFGVLSVMRL